ncbi:MAG: hypothetical protein GX058_06270 [Firmicutes bacterium]|nr:hypothetical protein [Bacillota bacterium]
MFIVAMLVSFALIMGAGWDGRAGKSAEVGKYLDLLYANLAQGDWSAALMSLGELERAWSSVQGRLGFIEERPPLFQFTNDLARLRGAIMAEDRSAGLQLVLEMRAIWAKY